MVYLRINLTSYFLYQEIFSNICTFHKIIEKFSDHSQPFHFRTIIKNWMHFRMHFRMHLTYGTNPYRVFFLAFLDSIRAHVSLKIDLYILNSQTLPCFRSEFRFEFLFFMIFFQINNLKTPCMKFQSNDHPDAMSHFNPIPIVGVNIVHERAVTQSFVRESKKKILCNQVSGLATSKHKLWKQSETFSKLAILSDVCGRSGRQLGGTKFSRGNSSRRLHLKSNEPRIKPGVALYASVYVPHSVVAVTEASS